MRNDIPTESEIRDKSFSDVYNEKLKQSDKSDNCTDDSCDVKSILKAKKHEKQRQEREKAEEEEELTHMVQGLPPEAKIKLLKWIRRFEPMDVDLPGYSTREQGV